MARALSFEGASTGSGATMSALFTLPGSASVYLDGNSHLEYDLFVETMPGPSISSFGFVVYDSGGDVITTQADQDGLAGSWTASVAPNVIERSSGGWYRRVLPLPFSVAASNWRVGYSGSGGLNPSLYLRFKIANIRISRFRETVLWLWRDGMALPGLSSSTNMRPFPFASSGSPTLNLVSLETQTLPDYCSLGQNQLLDDIRQERSTGGRLTSQMFWDRRSNAYSLRNIRVNARQRWDMETFYDLFRRDAFIYKHQANLPGEYVKFGRPPRFDDVPVNGPLTWDMSLELLRR